MFFGPPSKYQLLGSLWFGPRDQDLVDDAADDAACVVLPPLVATGVGFARL